MTNVGAIATLAWDYAAFETLDIRPSDGRRERFAALTPNLARSQTRVIIGPFFA